MLRDVIAAITGESGPQLDHFQCDMATVLALVQQQVSKAAEEGRAAGEKEGARGARDQVDRAAREAREKAEQELSTTLAVVSGLSSCGGHTVSVLRCWLCSGARALCEAV